MRHLSQALTISVSVALLAVGCTSVSVQPTFEEVSNSQQRAQLQACSTLFAGLDRAISRSGVKDTQAARIAGFPYLRSNRFLTSFRHEVITDAAFDAWLDRLQRLAEQGYDVELRNLPKAQTDNIMHSLPSSLAQDQDLSMILRDCGARLRHHQFAKPTTQARLREAVRAPTEYTKWRRALGLYPVTALGVRRGIARWHRITHDRYAQAVDTLPVRGELVSYVPPTDFVPLTPAAIKALLEHSAQNALGIPEPSDTDTQRLFATFAPRWQIDVVTNDDRIGAPTWLARGASKPSIDTARPAVYRHVSHTRVGSDVLLQLNYIIWFPARPRTSVFDTLGGRLDGITWRVTLSRDGRPLLYDSMHNCGCYHMFFPSAKLRPREHAKGPGVPMREPILIPQAAPSATNSTRLTIRIAHRTHYVERVLGANNIHGHTVSYRWANYDNLRSLPLVNGEYRSLFRQDGVVTGTKRRERFYLWPMGIPHPGEMRQWGHHATAFVGRRHFDDPDLLEDVFEFNDKE